MKKILVVGFYLLQFQIFGQPVISSFAPVSGPIGTPVTITGTGFSSNTNNNIVFFGAVRASVAAASATSLSVTVPAGASYQSITVTTAGLTAYSSKPFLVTFTGGGIITSGSFAPKINFSASPNGPVYIVSKDLNNDGKPEIISGGSSRVAVYKNNSVPGTLSIAPQVSFTNPSVSFYIASEDMDGDGKPDIITPDLDFSVSILKNSSVGGNISFAPAVSFPTSGGYGLAVADFDGDGMPDYASTNNSNVGIVSVRRNTTFGGIISFAANQDFSTGNVPRGAATGYMNNDNKPDLIVANQNSNSFSVLLNTSTPGFISFSSKIDFATASGSSRETIGVGDLDGDGKNDIVINNSGLGTISVFLNTGSGSTVSFAPRLDLITASTYPYTIVINDMDGDGKPDILARHFFNNSVSVFRNKSTAGNLSFDAKVDFAAFDQERGTLSANDIDGDGKPDIVVGSANASSPNIEIFRNTIENPNITSFLPTDACAGTTITITGNNFTGTTAVSFGGTAATSFNVVSNTTLTAVLGNGTTGIVSVTNSFGTGTKTGFVYTGTCITPPVIISFTPNNVPSGSSIIITGQNFNATPANNTVYFGAAKAIVTTASTTSLTVTVPPGATNKPITVTVNSLTAYSPKFFNLGFSGDNICDAFTISSFETKKDFTTGLSPYSSAISDIDNNGKPDIVTANSSSNTFSILQNTSNAGITSFVTQTGIAAGTIPVDVAYGDFDGDGKTDLGIVNYSSNTVSVFRNTSAVANPSYSAKTDFITGSNPRNIYIHDLDLDGKPDIIVSNFSGNTISVLRNTSLGAGIISFASQVTFATGTSPTAIAIIDFDNDNKPDIAVTNVQSNTCSVFKNTSSGSGNISFNPKVDLVTGSQPLSIFSDDVNNDGKPDIAVSNNLSSTVSVFNNTSTTGVINFNAKVDFPTGSGPNSVILADLNGDKKIDIATANYFDGNISVLRNTGTGTAISFDTKFDYTSGTNPRNICIGDIDGDAKPDIIITNYGDNSVSVLTNNVNYVAGQLSVGAASAISSNLTGASYQWQLNSGSGFADISDNSNYSGSNSKILLLTNIPSSWYGYQYRCIVNGSNSDTISLSFVSRWLGTIDNNWENTANWSTNQLPDIFTDVTVDCNHSLLLNSNGQCRSLTLKPGTAITVKTGFTLTINQ